jgi:hypothetical protein
MLMVVLFSKGRSHRCCRCCCRWCWCVSVVLCKLTPLSRMLKLKESSVDGGLGSYLVCDVVAAVAGVRLARCLCVSRVVSWDR